jgi:5-methylthioadenosine/S-adenosylhomocysteine deaminase
MSRPGYERQIVRGGLVLCPGGKVAAIDILVERGEIVDLLPRNTPVADSKTGDASDHAIIPGLINAHVHGHGTLAKGLVDDRWPLEMFLNALPSLGANRTLNDKYLNGLLGAVEMIRKGCTACFDLFFEFPMPSDVGIFALGNAYREAGVRAVIAPMVADQTFYQSYPELTARMPEALREEALSVSLASPSETLASASRIFRNWPFDRSSIRPGLAPTIPLHCSSAFLLGCRDMAREFDLPLQMHLAESRTQAVIGLKRYSKSLTAHLEAMGMLGPHFSAVHAIWLDNEDMQRVANAGASIVHAPASNFRFGSGLARIRDLIELGVNVGLATDGTNSSDSLNMFEAMRAGSAISRILTSDFQRWLSASEMLRMATEGSAHALGFGGKIGRIEPGYQADLVFLDLSHINYVPLGDLERQVVFTENGAAVDSVMIAGRMVLERGNMLTVDEERLRRDANAAGARIFEENAALRARADRMQPWVQEFCRSAACIPYYVQRMACEEIR